MKTARFVAACALLAACGNAPAQRYDLLITGGTIIDGTGAARSVGDVAIVGDRIMLVSDEPIAPETAARVIDATGRMVAPGFIDLHAHLDPLFELPGAESHVRQGVTTALGGPDGGGPWPFAPYLARAESVTVGINVAFLAGHNTIRREIMGMANRAPTAAEQARMEAMVAQAMEQGAFGLSTGLRYTPGAFSETAEVIGLARAAAAAGGIYTSHLRDEGLDLMNGVGEAIRIARDADIPVVLTHHKVVGQPMWGSSTRTLALIDSARAAGLDVMADQYPYTATHTGISILAPSWALAGGDSAFLRRAADPALRDSVLAGIVWNIENDRGGGDLARVQLSRVEWDRSLEGRTLKDWAEREGKPTTSLAGAELVVEAIRRGGANAIYHVLDEGDVERIMRHPWTAIASDGRLTRPGDGHPHPRGYGTFPRVLGHYTRDRGVLTLEDAVRKMTSLPADRLDLRDRGRIVAGAFADLVVFDAATVADRATFQEPHQYPAGIDHVILNGTIAVDGGQFRDARAGRVLRRSIDAGREADIRAATSAADTTGGRTP
jgi:dihydroorotase/N-acyl-D-amino-acid deacylase